MLEAICKLLHGLGSADEGVECILNKTAYTALVDLIGQIYGEHASKVVSDAFDKRENEEMVLVMEDIEYAFRLCLTGNG